MGEIACCPWPIYCFAVTECLKQQLAKLEAALSEQAQAIETQGGRIDAIVESMDNKFCNIGSKFDDKLESAMDRFFLHLGDKGMLRDKEEGDTTASPARKHAKGSTGRANAAN